MKNVKVNKGFSGFFAMLFFLATVMAGGIPALAQDANGITLAGNIEPLKFDRDIEFPEDSGERVSLSGVIKDTKGQPIQGAWISAWSDSTFNHGDYGTGTDDNGAYTLSLSPASDYRVMAWAYGDEKYYENADHWEDATLVDVSGDAVSGIDFVLDTGAGISGTVSGLEKDAIAYIEAWSDSTWSWSSAKVTGTGADVPFTILGLADGEDYKINVWANGYLGGYLQEDGTLGKWDQIALIPSGKDDVVIKMDAGRKISGVISGVSQGERIWIEVSHDRDWGIEPMPLIDPMPVDDVILGDGTVNTDVPLGENEGDILPEPQAKDRGETPDADLPVVDFDSIDKDDPAFSYLVDDEELLIAPVADAGLPMDGKEDGCMMIEPWFPGNSGIEVIADGSTVNFTISGLLPNSGLRISVYSEGYIGGFYGGTLGESGAHPVAWDKATLLDTTDGDVSGVNILMNPGKTISGTITNAAPRQWVSVDAWSETAGHSGYAGVEADENGNASYEIKALGDASDYVVSAWSDRKNLFYNQQIAWEDAARVDVSNSSVTGIDFDFDAIKMFMLSGTIAGVEEDTFVWIDAWSKSRGGWGYAEVKGNGAFAIELPAGEYHLGIYAEGYLRAYYDAESGQLTEDWDAKALALTADKNLGTLTLSAGNSVSGVVTNSKGEAVADVWVQIFNEMNGMGGGAVTDENGAYHMAGLSDGQHFVSVWSIDGYYEGQLEISGSDVTHNITLGGMETGEVIGNVDPGEVVLLFDKEGLFVNAIETDDSGEYAFSGLEEGDYTVKVKGDDGYELLEEVDVRPAN